MMLDEGVCIMEVVLEPRLVFLLLRVRHEAPLRGEHDTVCCTSFPSASTTAKCTLTYFVCTSAIIQSSCPELEASVPGGGLCLCG